MKLETSKIIAVWTGLEPATPCVTGMYSNQLNYQTFSSVSGRCANIVFISKYAKGILKNLNLGHLLSSFLRFLQIEVHR